jgi:hypothetical protein
MNVNVSNNSISSDETSLDDDVHVVWGRERRLKEFDS